MPPKSILLVDDDLNLRRSLDLILRRAGYRVEEAGQASEVLACLRSNLYDLVILDITTPDDRLALLSKILPTHPDLSVMILTPQCSAEMAAEIKQLGICTHLVKPITPECLLDRVEAALRE
jgi:DNA-binding NtrC family response regulator